jgi:streptogramin lyase
MINVHNPKELSFETAVMGGADAFRTEAPPHVEQASGWANLRTVLSRIIACLAPSESASLFVSSQEFQAGRVLRYNGTTGAFAGVSAAGGGLNDPLGLTIGPDGNLYVASGNTNSILRFNGDTGAFMGVFASGGGLHGPSNIVFGADQNLYVSSFQSGAILRYNGTTGSFIDTFASGGGLNTPRGLVFGPDHNLYVVDYNDAKVLRYNGTNGSFLGTFVASGSGGLFTPSDLSFGPDGSLYVTGGTFGGNIGVFRYHSQTGAFSGVFASTPPNVAPIDLVFGPDQNLYVTIQGITSGVLRFNGTTGQFIDSFVTNGSGGLQNPYGLTFKIKRKCVGWGWWNRARQSGPPPSQP